MALPTWPITTLVVVNPDRGETMSPGASESASRSALDDAVQRAAETHSALSDADS